MKIENNNHEKIDPILKKQMVYQKKSKQILEKTLSFSGLKLQQQIDYRSVRIYEIDHMHEIYTKNQNSNLPHLVLLHGFGGTGMTFFRMFKYLKQYYQVHALDAMGVGHSSKGVFKNSFNYEQTKNYFVDAIQKWRIAANISDFTLAGHSFGGYLATLYADVYPQRVNRLILLSPAGVTEKTPQQIQQQMKKKKQQEQKDFKTKLKYYFAQKAWNWRIRPSKIMGSFYLGKKFIDMIVDTRLCLEDEQNKQWKLYFKDLSTKQAVGQTGFYIIFQFPLKTKHTLQTILTRMISTKFSKKPIQFYYGSHDWMDSVGARRMAEKYNNITFDRIHQAGHQLIFDNPYRICQFVVMRRVQSEKRRGY